MTETKNIEEIIKVLACILYYECMGCIRVLWRSVKNVRKTEKAFLALSRLTMFVLPVENLITCIYIYIYVSKKCLVF